MWTAVYIGLAVMVIVQWAGWPLVVVPLVLWFWMTHMAAIWKAYKEVTTPSEKKVTQNLTFNVRSEMTAEDVAAAAERAWKTDGQWNLTQR